MGLLGPGPDMMAEIGLDSRGFILGARQVETSLSHLARHPLFTAGVITSALAGAAVNAASQFEESMLGVAATMELTDEEMQGFGRSIRDLSREKPFSATDIATVVQIGGQLGIAKENVLAFTSTMLDMGHVSDMTAAEAADAFARFANAANVPQDKFDEMANTVRFLGRNLATTESEIVKMGFRIAGAGSLVGLSTDQTLGLAAALSSLGIKAEMGGSAASKILKALYTSVNSDTREAKQRLELFAQVAGTSAENFARVWQSSPQAALVQFLAGLSALEESGGNVVDTLGQLGLSEVRVSDVALRAKNGQELLRKSLVLAGQGWSENSALTTEAARRYESTRSSLRLLGADIRDVAIGFGEDMLPAVNNVIGGLREFIRTGGGAAGPIVSELGHLKDETVAALAKVTGAFLAAFDGDGEKNVATVVDALAGALRILTGLVAGLAVPAAGVAYALGQIFDLITTNQTTLTVFAGLVTFLTGVSLAWQVGLYGNAVAAGAFTLAMNVMTVATNVSTAAMALWTIVTSPITLIILGIAVAITGLVLIWQNWDKVVAGFNATVEWLSGALGAAWNWMKQVGAAVGDVLIAAWDSLVTATESVVGAVTGAWGTFRDFVVGVFTRVQDAVSGAWTFVSDAFQGGVDWLTGFAGTLLAAFTAPFTGFFEAIKVTLASVFLAVYGLFTGDFDLVTDALRAWSDRMLGIFSGVFDAIIAPIREVVTTIRDIGSIAFDRMREGFEAGWERVTSWLGGLSQSAAAFFANLPGSLYDIGSRFITAIKDGGVAAWTAVSTWVAGLPQLVVDGVVGVVERVRMVGADLMNGLKTGALEAWTDVRSYFERLPARLVNAVGDLGRTGWEVGSALVDGIKQGFENAWATVKNWLSGLIGNLVQWAKDILGIRSPSTVFAGIGENVVDGFREGIADIGDLANGTIHVDPITMNGGGGVGGQARGGVTIGTLVVHASGRREGDEAARAFERRLMRLGMAVV